MKKIFSFILLSFVMLAYQNCGSGLGLLPGESVDGFQSNGGGYSGIHGEYASMPSNPGSSTESNVDEVITIGDGSCSGKIMTYHLISNSCSPTGLTSQDWSGLLANNIFSLNNKNLTLPTDDEAVCAEFVGKYVFVIDACENTIKQIDRQDIEYIGNGTHITIDGSIYKSFGIQNIKVE